MDGTVYKMSLMAVAANFVNIVAPSAGMGGMAIFISDANRNGRSPGKVTVVSMLYLFLDYIAFLVVLTLGLIILSRRNNLRPKRDRGFNHHLCHCRRAWVCYYILAHVPHEALGNALAWMARLVNRIAEPFIHRDYLSEARAHRICQ